jgi:hypothetical protein
MASFTEAAYIILKTEGKPLHSDEITRRAIAQNMIATNGKTPAGTMRASLYLENKRKIKSGKNTRFKQLPNNMWELSN